ncbi:acetyl-CoA synthetase-like protein [Aspergillus ellipticus CBS 707.79]|uniref:Acetyl-CoA synthetase-like protein n=1 Tax=Aspergillus ellipticus CBS 707.79 TaxID=1448320 RepID=A0A319DIT0_9EURO|nr:acetyl-CoA synthetase-like protein [Aspergillus ellipticus CBS 707.79]
MTDTLFCSTGTPKGLNGRRRWLLFYNPVFSAAQRTILATLAKGACLCLARRDRLATALPEVLANLQVDALGITLSALALLSTKDVPRCLQQVTPVGEPLSQNLVDLWADRVHLRVSYGLSECAQLNFSRQLKKGDNPRNPGRPVDTTTVVILEPGTGRESPVGEPGELCLSGPQIANGYHHRIKETNTAFVKNPLGSGILFRTGDQAVRLPDNTFEILGRIDHQIKIHGQRVEPQEVAEKLARIDGVAALVCIGSRINEKSSLVAAVIPVSGADWESLVQTLRDHAQRLFPPYMVPSYWLHCDKFPVNRNGKVDFKAVCNLAESTDVRNLLGRRRSTEGEAHIFSKVALEIVEAWANVLHPSPSFILPTDSFVALGGTSIEAIRSQSVEDVADASRIASQDASRPVSLEPFSLLSDEMLKVDLLADRGVVDAFPTTALQEGILASTIQGNPDYLYQRVFDIRHLDLVRLQLAFQVVFWQSETLRSSFISATKGFVQVTRNDFDLPWTELSISLDKYLEDDKNSGVTLGEPFMRVAVIDKSILVASVHHALFDFWSHGFVFDDVARVYYGRRPIKRAHWKSFVGHVHDQDQSKSEQFWRQHLAEATVHHLSLNFNSASAALQVPSSAIFDGAWALVLSLHTASKSVSMATAISGRELPRTGIETLDGPTLAMVPQAVLINPDESLLDLVRSVNVNLWSIIRHSQHGMRGAFTAAGHQPSSFLDTMVNILVRGEDKNELTGEVFQTFGRRSAWKTEYTTLNIEEGDKGFEFSLTSPMEPRRVEFILNQFFRAVETIVHNPRLIVRSLDLVDNAELDFLLQWNDEQHDALTLHGEFEAVVHLYPTRTAINFQNQQLLSYAELNERADRMANFLSERGVTPGDIVPLLLEKSPFMMITILAPFKIGAAYVPLSPENPLDRNAFIAHDVEFPSVSVDQARLCAYSTEKPLAEVSPNTLAYILYTSGSTGQPKGVTTTHGACAAAMRSIIQFEGKQGKQFRALQFSNYVFDVSLYDFFVTLHSGGTLCIAPSERLLSDLARAINEMDVNHVFLTPTVARLLSPEDVPGLESMTVGGEQLTRDVVTTWASRLTLRNGYGPTEASVLVTMKEFDATTTGGNIRNPLASVGAVILEADGVRPVPYGAVGELCFWGPQLSQGYFKKPEITAAAFVDSDIGGGRRLYRSVFDPVDDDFHVLPLERFSDETQTLKSNLSGLAHYMVPKFILPLPFLPRLPSGKADRKQLKARVQSMSQSELSQFSFDKLGLSESEEIIPLVSDKQKTLQQGWIEILQLPDDQSGLEANFLSLGGDSISAINLVSWLRRRQLNATVRDVLRYPLLGSMAEQLQQESENAKASQAVIFSPPTELTTTISSGGLQQEQYEYIYSCPPGQAEFLTQGARAETFWCLMAVRALGTDTEKVAQWVDLVKQLTQTNDILRTTFTKSKGTWYGVVLHDHTPVVEYFDVADAVERKKVIDAIWADKFVFGKPFIRYAILRHTDGAHEVVTKLDHGLYDGTLLRVFDAHFQTYQKQETLEPFTSFKEFAFHIWQINQTRPTLDFWTQPDKRPIQFLYPSNASQAQPHITASVVHMINLDLDSFSRSQGVTVSIMFQAIFQLWLAFRSKQQDVSFDYLYTGRNPFEPAGAPEQYQRWVIMAKSEVTMPQPYAVVFEVIKTADPNAYKLKLGYDRSVWTSEEVKEEARIVERMLSSVVENSDARIEKILRV